jgi:hypothetical protein
MTPKLNDAADIVAAIRESLSKAYRESQHWDVRSPEDDEEQLADYFMERAFTQTLIFLEAAGLPDAATALAKINDEAKKDYSDFSSYSEGIYLVWAAKLESFVEGIEATFVRNKQGTVTKELLDILRATLYSITDRRCFPFPPKDEGEVHSRIEAVLRCVFPDLRNKPSISKPVKNFEPDTGIPSLRTLIEYKYVDSADRVKVVVDEVLADTRGYVSKEWERFIYVIYETARLKPETEWREMLEQNGVGSNTEIIVLSGEPKLPDAAPNRKQPKEKQVTKD